MNGTLATLYGRHVRLRPVNSPARPTVRRGPGDSFGALVDLGSQTHAGLDTRYEREQVAAFQLDQYRIEEYPFRRVHVFFYPYNDENFWTWCREIGGDVLDSYSGLDRHGTRDEAWTAARKWLEKMLAQDVEAERR